MKTKNVEISLLVLLTLHTDNLVLSILVDDESSELSTLHATRVEAFGIFVNVKSGF